jgi:hypothetical protein
MKALMAMLVFGLSLLTTGGDTGQKKVAYDVYNGHFEKNNSGLKGESSYLVLTGRDAFDKVFGIGRVIGQQNFVPKDVFEKKLVVAVIKRGDAVTKYDIKSVTAKKDMLYIEYTTTPVGAGGSARFASPLLISVDRDDLTSVVFVENQKKAYTVKIQK